jgi:hypothetical protein
MKIVEEMKMESQNINMENNVEYKNVPKHTKMAYEEIKQPVIEDIQFKLQNPPVLADIPLIKGDYQDLLNKLQFVSIAKREEELFLP